MRLQALEQVPSAASCNEIAVKAWREGAVVIISKSPIPAQASPKPSAPISSRPFMARAARASTGLGLAIAAELVTAHNGEITLEETQRGACFRIVIPDRVVPASQPKLPEKTG